MVAFQGEDPSIEGLRSRLDSLESVLQQMQKQQAAMQAQITDIVGAINDTQKCLAATIEHQGALQRQIETISRQQGDLEETIAAQRAHFNAQIQTLVFSQPGNRLPGAESAVSRLGRPGVSIVLPTFNRVGCVGEAVRSVQQQDYRDWELLVVDDGSTDATREAIAPLLAGDPRIRYIRQEHAGVARARNTGLAHSTAPLVAYLDSDNLWHPGFLAAAVDHLAVHAACDLVYAALVSREHCRDGGCLLLRAFDRAELLKANFIDINVVVHRRSLVEKFGGWDESFRCLEDWELMLRFTAERPAEALPVLGAFYRTCDAQRVSQQEDTTAAEAAIHARYPVSN